jgi:hypothetical protein
LDFHLSNSGDVFRRVCRLSCDRVRHTPLIERQLGVFLGDSPRSRSRPKRIARFAKAIAS